MPRHLKNLRINEVSSVDRGAGEGVRMTLMKRLKPDALYTSIDKGDLSDDVVTYLKREFSADERRSAASSGAALPDGSFPIKNTSDLHNAVQAIGRAKDPARAKAHIKSRAAALGATSALPDSWSKRDEDKAAKALALTIETILGDGDSDQVVKSAAIIECFKQFHSYLAGSEENDMTLNVNKADLEKLIANVIIKTLAEAGIKITKMTEEHSAYHSQLDGDEASKFSAMGHDERNKYMDKHPIGSDDEHDPEPEGEGDEKEQKEAAAKMRKALVDAGLSEDVAKKMTVEIMKARPKKDKKEDIEEEGDDEPDAGAKKAIVKALEPMVAENAKLKKQLDVLTEKDQQVEFSKRAVDLGLVEADGDLLLKVHRGDPAAIKKLEEKIKALTTQVQKGDVFGEFGNRQPNGGSAYDKLVGIAAELRKNNPEMKLTAEQAFEKVMLDPANAELVKMEKRDRDARVQKIAI
jgi:hypothetical protein